VTTDLEVEFWIEPEWPSIREKALSWHRSGGWAGDPETVRPPLLEL
jgi:hypothetical protein